MTAFMARTDAYQPPGRREQVRVTVHAGVDQNHLRFAGIVVLKPDEIVEFMALINSEKEPVRE